MDQIDIAMTAVLRPQLLNETLIKIKQFVVDDISRFRLIINIDPIGEKVDPMAVVRVAEKHFERVTWNIPEKPSFPKAVQWVWSQVETEFFFHWEDDSFILRKINVNKMIKIMKKHQELSSLRLYKNNTPKKKAFFIFQSRWILQKEGNFYVAARWQEQFGLNPILIRKKYIDQALPCMVDNINPEKQFRVSNKKMAPVIKQWKCGLYTKPGERALVWGKKGQQWKNKLGLAKPVGKTFLNWEKKKKKKKKQKRKK